MSQIQSNEKHDSTNNKINSKSFAHFWVGMFFLLSSISLFILMMMFIFVWQPIWTEGFEDFHTISNAIDKLDETAKPASNTIPLMLVEMNKMNKNMYQMNSTMYDMQLTMRNMDESLGTIEKMTPDIRRMSLSIEQMTLVLTTEIPRMTYLMGRVDNKMPNMDFMPFN